MHPTDNNNLCEEVVFEDEKPFVDFKKDGTHSIAIVNEPYGEIEENIAKPDTGDFVKWLHESRPDISVRTHEEGKRLVLHSSDYWLPLVFIASDVTLPIYLNLVASYLYDKSKGLLKGESARVHMSAVYEDSKSGTIKKFNFEGDSESLQKAIKKFDLNKFMD